MSTQVPEGTSEVVGAPALLFALIVPFDEPNVPSSIEITPAALRVNPVSMLPPVKLFVLLIRSPQLLERITPVLFCTFNCIDSKPDVRPCQVPLFPRYQKLVDVVGSYWNWNGYEVPATKEIARMVPVPAACVPRVSVATPPIPVLTLQSKQALS